MPGPTGTAVSLSTVRNLSKSEEQVDRREFRTQGQTNDSPETPTLVTIGLKELASGVREVLTSHEGSLPLSSLAHCYEQICGSRLGGEMVPLEHLLQAVDGVSITSSDGVKMVVDTTVVRVGVNYIDFLGPPPALATQLIVFTREVVDLLKSVSGCTIPFFQFVPSYYQHFGKQCRPVDYGFAKLVDLLESIPHVVQMLGEGPNMFVTLSHRAQVKRFTNDLLKILKMGPEKNVKLSALADRYEICFHKPFNISDYGVCYPMDILGHVAENTFVLEKSRGDSPGDKNVVISLFRREQTPEEMVRTKEFAKEVMELVRNSTELAIPFNKFIPVYHQYFGRQCKVAHYGLAKLVDLFEVISDTVEVSEEGEERLVQLTRDKMVSVVGEQVESLVQASKGRSLPLVMLEEEYLRVYGQQVPLVRLGLGTVEEMVELLHPWVRREGDGVVTVDKSFIRTMANNVRRLLVEQEEGQMDLGMFMDLMADRFGSHIDFTMLRRDLSFLVTLRGGVVCLTDLQMCARDIQQVLGEVGRLPVAELETKYEARFGREMPLVQLGFDCVTDLLSALSDTLSVRGRGIRKVVCVNQSSAPPRSFSNNNRPLQSVAFRGRGFDMLRLVNPSPVPRPPPNVPRPYSPPTHTQQPPLQGFSNPRPYRHISPLVFGSPPTNEQYLMSSSIPIASPNSPMTPTPGHSQPYLYPMGFCPTSHTAWGSPPVVSRTFQQHMMQHSPCPLITPTRAPFIVQPISRTFQEQALSQQFSHLTLAQSGGHHPGLHHQPGGHHLGPLAQSGGHHLGLRPFLMPAGHN